MKTIICHCEQCLASRRSSKVLKTNRVQTYEVRAARSRAKEILKKYLIDRIEEALPQGVSVDYYA